MTIHPTIQLLAWVAFAIAIPWLDVAALGGVTVLLALGLWLGDFATCWRLLRRTRILLIALILFYALATPGAPIFPASAIPTHEGLQAGLLQAWRLLMMIAALALILANLSREALLGGIYGMLLPFKPLGLPLERIAVRLWLTLQYAEVGLQANTLHERWQAALAEPAAPATSVTLNIPALHLRDVLFMIGFGALLMIALAW